MQIVVQAGVFNLREVVLRYVDISGYLLCGFTPGNERSNLSERIVEVILVKYWSTVMIVGLFGNGLVEVVCAMGEFKLGRG